MMLLRTPMVLVGLLLTLIGVGNIYTGYSKTAEYELLLADRSAASPPARPAPSTDSGTWRSPLLSRVQIEETPLGAARAKLDFYRVVYSGGRLVALLGVFCVVTGTVLFWYRQTHTQLAASAGDS